MSGVVVGVSVIVVGGGVFGVSSAIELHRRGYKVCLVEPSGSTANPLASSTDITKVLNSITI